MATRTVDSALGRWTHTTWCPPRLAAVVEHLWHFEGRVTLLRERTFPGGHVELIVHLGPRYRGVDAGGGGATPYPVACVAGVQTTPLVVEAPDAPSCVLGVRLRPVGAYCVLGVPLPALTDATHDLAGVVGRAAAELADRCHDALTAAARFACVATWIEARLARSPARTTAPDARIVRAAAQLERSHGATPVGALRDAAGLGRALAVSLPFYGTVILAQYLVLEAVGADLPLLEVVLLAPLVPLLSLLPLSLNGLGLAEAVFVLLYGSAGVPPETALAAAALRRLVDLANSGLGGLLWLVFRNAAKRRETAGEEPAMAWPPAHVAREPVARPAA